MLLPLANNIVSENSLSLLFNELGIRVHWEGHGEDEVGIADGKVVVQVDRRYFRPLEPGSLLGDASKAKQQLGWRPRISFAQLVSDMVQSDLAICQSES